MSLRQQRVVVIGGTSGIGRAVAEGAKAEGAAVVVGSSGTANVAAAAGQGLEAHAVDVTDDASVAAFFDRIGAFDHLVFTAGDWGSFRGGPIETLDIAAASRGFAVRFWGAATAVKHARRHIRPAGSIVLTNGMIAHRAQKGTTISSAMAGSVEHLARALAVELAPIRVNCVCPGAIRTEVWNSIPEDKREERFKQMTARLPVPRVGEPDEVAAAYLYLLRGGYTTGQVLRVDGGQSVI